MIAVDTSALIAVLLHEPAAEACAAFLENEPHLIASAGTVTEALIVATGRGFADEMEALIDGFGIQIVPVTAASARRAAAAYRRWGKGVHPAGLNFGDCFAYEVAITNACPLLFVGADFSATDVVPALSAVT